MAPDVTRKSFQIKPNLFLFNLGKVFQLPEFQAKLFFKQNWVGGS